MLQALELGHLRNSMLKMRIYIHLVSMGIIIVAFP